MHICVNKVEKRKDFVYLSVYNSICPPISSNEHGYWAYLPENDSKEWIPFVSEEREGDAFYENEVIVRLHNGSIYTGFIQWFGFEPSFNLFKSVPRESISHYMSLPEYPPELAEIMQKINNEE